MLVRVEEGAFSSRLLSGGGSPAVRVRVLEVLRSMRTLDAVLRKHCNREIRKLDAEVRAALRIGLAETMRLGLPPELATDGAVRLARRLGKASASGMVNAVLRKASAGWREVLSESAIDIQLSHPEWLCRRWIEHFGEAATEAAMAAAQEPAVTWAWFLEEDGHRHLIEDGVALRAHPWCPDSWSAPGDVGRLIQEVGSGTAYAQDPSSQMVAHVARSLANDGCRFLDLCAAPGGKTALLLHLGGWSAAAAADIRLNRARMMRSLLEHAGECLVIAADASAAPFAPGIWDLVLLDAPCTGTGTFRRHPELKWRLGPDSIDNLATKQKKLVDSGLSQVAPGGALLYTTCSVEPEENEDLLADLPDGFDIESIEPHLPNGVPWLPTPSGGIRILPNPNGDGFTLHAVRRSLKQ
jgi:16S rRNA (cytosine967-C5)-methyltransferase